MLSFLTTRLQFPRGPSSALSKVGLAVRWTCKNDSGISLTSLLGKTSESVHCTILNKLCACQRMRHRPSARPLYRFGRLALFYFLQGSKSPAKDGPIKCVDWSIIQQCTAQTGALWVPVGRKMVIIHFWSNPRWRTALILGICKSQKLIRRFLF